MDPLGETDPTIFKKKLNFEVGLFEKYPTKKKSLYSKKNAAP